MAAVGSNWMNSWERLSELLLLAYATSPLISSAEPLGSGKLPSRVCDPIAMEPLKLRPGERPPEHRTPCRTAGPGR